MSAWLCSVALTSLVDGHSLPPPPMSTAAVGGYPTTGYGQPGKISDYDPYQENSTFNSPYSAKSQATTIYDSRIGQGELV